MKAVNALFPQTGLVGGNGNEVKLCSKDIVWVLERNMGPSMFNVKHNRRDERILFDLETI